MISAEGILGKVIRFKLRVTSKHLGDFHVFQTQVVYDIIPQESNG